MWHAAEEPAECRAFQSPTNSDPLSIELDRENQRNEKQRRAAEESELRITCRAGERWAFEQYEQSEQRRHRKCSGHETRNPVRIRGANQLIDQIKVQRPNQGGCSPRHSFSDELPMENEGKDAEHRVKPEVPNQRQHRPRRIEMFEMPRVLQCENAGKSDRRQQIERKHFTHGEE